MEVDGWKESYAWYGSLFDVAVTLRYLCNPHVHEKEPLC
jgi:hypothetical protein